MRQIINYLKLYLSGLNPRLAASAICLTGLLIFINYYYGLNNRLSVMNDPQQMLCWFLVFIFAFGGIYFISIQFKPASVKLHWKFYTLVVLAPAIFAWKISAGFSFHFTNDHLMNAYWSAVVYWPLKFLVVAVLLFLIWKILDNGKDYFGLRARNFNAKPYLFMLAIMIPLIALASTQKDFLSLYPRMQNISYLESSPNNFFYRLLYEIAYGIDFISIELFFRGFLIIAFARYAGTAAILPMAVFYCTIHFGKPLGECISSFFGGILLGVVTYHTRTIYGGLIIHLGIAWMMEIGGLLGNHFLK
ncbi:MAG: CPBP family intramembrane metalloprotease [Flavisolibacter sp.]|jgi:hypothetical protein|nr:CPBP family intramembrane metalloprotease [Flavisolibacter sp.]